MSTLILLIIIIIFFIYCNNSTVTGGNDELLNRNFKPTHEFWDVMNEKKIIHKFDYKRYTRTDQVKQIAKFGNRNEYARLTELLGKFLTIPIQKLCNYTHLPDSEIKKLVKKTKVYPQSNDQAQQFNTKLQNITKYAKVAAKEWCAYKSIENYLDYGCSDGTNTRAIGKVLKAKNTHGCDVVNTNPQNVKFSLVIDGKPLPYPDNTFEIISIIHVLHHVDDVNFLISELRRILKPNGIIYMIDHRIHNDMDAMLVDIEHWLWDVSGSKVDGEYSVRHYPNFKHMDDLYFKHNFSHIISNPIYYNFLEQPSPTLSYYTLYMKNMKPNPIKYIKNDKIVYNEIITK